jgi:CBS domain-containing protein
MQGVSGVPIVDAQGVVVGNLSEHHLRLVLADPSGFPDLNRPLSEFSLLFPAVATCHANWTVRQCLDLLATRHAHRIYLVNDQNQPIRVLALTDFITKFVKEPGADYFNTYDFLAAGARSA